MIFLTLFLLITGFTYAVESNDDFFTEMREKTVETYLAEHYSNASPEERDVVRKELTDKLNASQDQISYALLISGSLKYLREFHEYLALNLVKFGTFTAITTVSLLKIIEYALLSKGSYKSLLVPAALLFPLYFAYQVFTMIREAKVASTLFPIVDKTLCAMLEPVES